VAPVERVTCAYTRTLGRLIASEQCRISQNIAPEDSTDGEQRKGNSQAHGTRASHGRTRQTRGRKSQSHSWSRLGFRAHNRVSRGCVRVCARAGMQVLSPPFSMTFSTCLYTALLWQGRGVWPVPGLWNASETAKQACDARKNSNQGTEQHAKTRSRAPARAAIGSRHPCHWHAWRTKRGRRTESAGETRCGRVLRRHQIPGTRAKR